MISNKKINVDLSSKNTTMNSLILTQYDKGFYVEISLFDNGQPYIIEKNESIKLEFKLGNIAVIENDVTIIDTNKCKFKVRREMTLNSCKGTFTVAIIDKETGVNIRKGSSKLALEVVGSSVSENTVETSLITTTKEKLDESITKAQNAKTSLDASIKTGQLSNYTLKTDFNNLEIGGRNLVVGASQYTKDSPYNHKSKSKDGYNESLTFSFELEVGTYTIQAKTDGTWIPYHLESKGNDPSEKLVTLWLYRTDGDINSRYICLDMTKGYAVVNIITKGTYKIRVNSYSDGNTFVSVNFWDFKLEKGNKPTDWTPAPEDINNQITEVDTKIITTNTEVKKLIQDTALETKKALYPVGSLYFNGSKETNPSKLLGFGTWEQIAQGRTLVGVSTTDSKYNEVNKTGGNETHKLTYKELPSKVYVDLSHADGQSSSKWVGPSQLSNWCNQVESTSEVGNESFSIIQPYLTVYIWKRVS